MPPATIIDLTGIDLNRILYDQEGVRAVNPQRGDMEMLNAIVYADAERGEIIGYKDVKADEFWVPGHIPGRPLFPGVLMIETAAQVASFYTKEFMKLEGFIGFGAVDGVKFRGQVLPGHRLYMLCKKTGFRHKRIVSDVQGIVDGNIVFEGVVTGVQF